MHWIHSSRQGWLVLATGVALLGGCGAVAHAEAGLPADLAQPAGSDLPASGQPELQAPPLPEQQAAADGFMMLQAGR